jgi:hypothetical protein
MQSSGRAKSNAPLQDSHGKDLSQLTGWRNDLISRLCRCGGGGAAAS